MAQIWAWKSTLQREENRISQIGISQPTCGAWESIPGCRGGRHDWWPLNQPKSLLHFLLLYFLISILDICWSFLILSNLYVVTWSYCVHHVVTHHVVPFACEWCTRRFALLCTEARVRIDLPSALAKLSQDGYAEVRANTNGTVKIISIRKHVDRYIINSALSLYGNMKYQ